MEEFLWQEMNTEIDGPYNLEPLKELCRTRNYQPGLIVGCLAPAGGMGNVRNIILNCIRFALEGGATGFIVPEIMVRSASWLPSIHTNDNTGFTYMFDLAHFLDSFSTACPRVKIYQNTNELPTSLTTNTAEPNTCYAPSLSKQFNPVAATLIEKPKYWREQFDIWLNKNVPPFAHAYPTLVTFSNNDLFVSFPMSYDSPEFIASFGKLLKFREDLRRLAATVLYALSDTYGLHLTSRPFQIQQGRFLGAHLRTESDAQEVEWPNYDFQSINYLNAAITQNLPIIYLASGSSEDSTKFISQAFLHGINVTTKDILLSSSLGPSKYSSAVRELEALTWDQRGIVDYLVLLRSSYFVGMYESSSAWNVVNRRHVVVRNGNWIAIDEENRGGGRKIESLREGLEECFWDEKSAIFGPVGMESSPPGRGSRWHYPLGLWP
ncbi:hypothetical protein BDZ45DRAFT_661063 [Acephala macrosclerotiorum]|nr:hypothetical protein BDZ45DRAFT_661063 [Acephala macrosclerotiorum]